MKKMLLLTAIVFIIFFGLYGTGIGEDDGVRIKNLTSQSIVRVSLDGKGWGTGFFVNDKYIVTNHHVVSPHITSNLVGGEGWFEKATNENVQVVFSAVNNDTVGGLVVQDWPEVDLAVVEIDSAYSKRSPIKLLPENKVVEGMNLWVVGFPGVNSYDEMTNDNSTITGGILSKITHDSIGKNSIPFFSLSYDSISNPGSSGGPVVDRNGNVLGIHNSGVTEDGHIAFYGIHVKELTSRLTAAGIPFLWADAKSGVLGLNKYILWGGIGILGVLIIGLLIYIAKKPAARTAEVTTKKTGTSTGGQVPAPIQNGSIQGLSGQFSGQKKPLTQEKDIIFGKDPSVCTFLFNESEKKVSRTHCLIHYSKTYQRFVIQDQNSTNGTILVRGSSQKKVPADSSIALKNGDLIYIPDKSNSFQINL